ncbi:hypothetical protein L1887_18241 [Cichorium endivia]|nr:hypothetical protein L1887_18241 [Cichorium endivia]
MTKARRNQADFDAIMLEIDGTPNKYKWAVKGIIQTKYGQDACNVGDEACQLEGEYDRETAKEEHTHQLCVCA